MNNVLHDIQKQYLESKCRSQKSDFDEEKE